MGKQFMYSVDKILQNDLILSNICVTHTHTHLVTLPTRI